MGGDHGTLVDAFVGASADASESGEHSDSSSTADADALEACTGRCSEGPGTAVEASARDASAGDACKELSGTPAFRGHGTLASQLACSPGGGHCSSRDRAGTPPSGGTWPATRVGPSSFACEPNPCSCRDDSWG